MKKWVSLGVFAMALTAFLALNRTVFAKTIEYPPSDARLVNPFIGNAVWASSDDERITQLFTLVYADLTWREFEPEKGAYDFESFEKRNRLAHWRELGKRVVFRFVLDVPGETAHMDIPDWLYNETKSGKNYGNEYGKGYCPDYSDAVLIEAHERAIKALGERYGGDSMFAYIQMGSLGHWGEWHINPGIKAVEMPEESVRDKYAMQYVKAFPKAKLMMRRPFNIAKDRGLGLYNDMSGDEEGTRLWLEWIAEGGDYEKEKNGLSAMPDGWKKAPVGGELATSSAREELLEEKRYAQCLELFELSHTSVIGPRCFDDMEKDGQLQKRLDAIMRRIGYRLRVKSLTIEKNRLGNYTFTTTWQNDGIAPFYFDWYAALVFEAESGKRTVIKLPLKLIKILPEEPQKCSVKADIKKMEEGRYKVFAAIIDPDTKEPGVELAMDTEKRGKCYKLADISIRSGEGKKGKQLYVIDG